MKRTSVAARLAIALALWLLLAYLAAPTLFAVFGNETFPDVLWEQFEVHAVLCVVGAAYLEDVIPSLRPFANSLSSGSIFSLRVTPAGWAVMATVHLLIGAVITTLGTIGLGGLEQRLERRG